MIVQSELDRLGLGYKTVELGEVELMEKPSALKAEQIKKLL